MTSVVWTLMLMVTATALVFHFMPRFSRPDILFGVTVPEAFVTGAGRTLVSSYRTIVWISAAATLAILLLLQGRPDEFGGWGMLMTAVMTGNIVAAHGAWQWARLKARPHAVPPSDVRVA